MTALWHYHAALMITGFFLLCTGMLIARYMKSRRSWLRVHKLMGLSGALVILSGLVVAIYMVSASTGAHFSVPHAYLGPIILIFAVMTPILGYAQFKPVGEVVTIRTIHRWSGRITLVLLLINILSSISMVGAL